MKTCLIVDDSKVIRKVARHMMEQLGFAVTEAEHGQIALDQCRIAVPDLVLLDWNMPVMNGIEFLGALNGFDFGDHPRPQIMFCTTENSVAHIRAAIEAGADEYIMKPFDLETMQSKLALIGFE